jgi:hypothetical protein
MANDFASFKKSSKTASNILAKELEKVTKGGGENSYKDDRMWQPEVDKTGNGYAVIRFLPAPPSEDLPWVRVFSHGFQSKGGWYIENCPTTIGQKCPVCEANNELWNSGNDDDKNIARDRKRKLSYISNILVVDDPVNPANNGKIFLYRYGKKIFDKINDKMNPQYKDEDPVNPFDFWQGANFKIKIRNVDGYRNYDKSEFSAASPLLEGDDKALEAMWRKEYSLQDFVKSDQFKQYGELKTKFQSVINGSSTAKAENMDLSEDEEETPQKKFTPKFPAAEAKSPGREAKPKSKSEDSDEDDDALNYFRKLANE